MYRKSLLTLMILATLPVIASTDKTIYVTTFEDEDGENNNACSLREALKAAESKRPYGGCSAGEADVTTLIKLKSGTYKLNRSLEVASNVSISGEDAVDYNKNDEYTGKYPARTDLKTTIEGNGSFSLFDSTRTRSALTLNMLALKNGGGAYGGAVRAGGSVNLNRVNITDSTATKSGGAVYLEGTSANLSTADTLFERNNAARGAVIGMSCLDNIKWTPHAITLERNSIIKNGLAGAHNIIEFCGVVTGTINTSTIGQNNSRDAIIKFTNDELNKEYALSPESKLVLDSNTIVQNNALSTLLYDKNGTLSLSNNVIAYNSGGKSCHYASDTSQQPLKDFESGNVAAYFNAIKKPTDTGSQDDVCDLPGYLFKAETTKFLDVSGVSFSSLLSNLSQEKNSVLPFYLPKPKLTGTTAISLVDASDAGCSAIDQRGLSYNEKNTNNAYENQGRDKCDIGSVEVGQLWTGSVAAVSNTSLVQREEKYKSNIDFYQKTLDDPKLDKKLVERYKKLLSDEKKALAAFKANLAYRQVYIDIFERGTPQEVYDATQSKSIIEHFTDDKYDVKVEALGRGTQQFIEQPDNTAHIDPAQKANISCTWNPELKQVLLRRTDSVNGKPQAVTTPAGEFEYCKYTLTLKSNPNISSSGYIQAQIVNIAPIAKDNKYYLKYGSNQEIVLDILGNDNDDGDGSPGVTGYPDQRKPFFQDPATGRYANIKLLEQPKLGKLIFEYEQPCPDNSSTRPEETCYGGQVIYKADNIYSPFNDSFRYKVIDQDMVESKEAKVEIINTATTTEDTRKTGGAFGVVGIFGLLGLAWLRRKLH